MNQASCSTSSLRMRADRIVSARVLAERHVANGAPAPDGAALRFQQQRQDVDHGGRVGQFCGNTAGLVVEGLQIVRQVTAEFVNARDDEFKMGAVLQPGILAISL